MPRNRELPGFRPHLTVWRGALVSSATSTGPGASRQSYSYDASLRLAQATGALAVESAVTIECPVSTFPDTFGLG